MRVLTVGEAMGLVATNDVGPFTLGSAARIGFCGSETNVAIGLARLGDDSFARLIRGALVAEGVTVVAAVESGRPTGLMTKESRTPRHQVVTYRRSTSPASRLSAADAPDELFEGIDLVHLTGILPALSASAADATRHVVREARRRGIPVSLDLNYRSRLWSQERAVETLRPLLSEVDVLFAGVDEAALFAGSADEPETLARRLHLFGPAEIVVTDGERGAVAFDGSTVHEIAARTVPLVDTIGAGDAFVAGYLAELLEGRDIPARLRTATITGAFACMSPSDWAGAPTRAELALLEAAEPVAR